MLKLLSQSKAHSKIYIKNLKRIPKIFVKKSKYGHYSTIRHPIKLPYQERIALTPPKMVEE